AVRRDPPEARRRCRQVTGQRARRDDVGRALAAVVREWVVTWVVRNWTVETPGAAQPLHVCAPAHAGVRQLSAEVLLGQDVVAIILNAPCLSGCEREVVRHAGVGDGVVVVGDAIFGRERGGERSAERLVWRVILHHDEKHVSLRSRRCRRWAGASGNQQNKKPKKAPQPHLSGGYR